MPLSHLEHFLVQTEDIERTRAWYCDVLGMVAGPTPDFKFPVVWLYIGDRDVVHVTEGGKDVSANRMAYLGQQSDATTGTGVVDHIAFRATGLRKTMCRLAALGVEFSERQVAAQGLYQLFLFRPERDQDRAQFRRWGGRGAHARGHGLRSRAGERVACIAVPPDESPCVRSGRMDGRNRSGQDGVGGDGGRAGRAGCGPPRHVMAGPRKEPRAGHEGELTGQRPREDAMAAARREIRLDDTMEPISHYTDAVLCGDFLYVSGAGPFDKDGALIGEGDVVRQCEATCANIDRVLSAADMSPSDVVYFKVLMEEVYDGPKINPVRIDFHGDSYPGSTRVGVGHFALPGMLLEIECVRLQAAANGGPPRQEIRCEDLFEPPSHYIDVVKCGDYAFISGTGPIASDGRAVHFGDPGKTGVQDAGEHGGHAGCRRHGFRRCLQGGLLSGERAGTGRRSTRRAGGFFGDSRPCSTLFGVRRLAIPGMNHEIEAIAYKPGAGAPPRTEFRVPGMHAPISHYTDAVQAGDFLFVSGQGPFDAGFALAGDTMTSQAEQVHDNLRRVMEEAGFGFGDVAKVTAYLDDCDERQELNAVRQRYFGRHRPASTLFGANRLAVHDMKLAIDAICYRPGAGGARS